MQHVAPQPAEPKPLPINDLRDATAYIYKRPVAAGHIYIIDMGVDRLPLAGIYHGYQPDSLGNHSHPRRTETAPEARLP